MVSDERITEAIRYAWNGVTFGPRWSERLDANLVQEIRAVIAEAIVAERGSCATIAQDFILRYSMDIFTEPLPVGPDARIAAVASKVSTMIAVAIRARGEVMENAK